jgi:hypothetical protein
LAFGAAKLNLEVFPVDVSEFQQPLAQRLDEWSLISRVGGAGNVSDARDFRRLLRVDRLEQDEKGSYHDGKD